MQESERERERDYAYCPVRLKRRNLTAARAACRLYATAHALCEEMGGAVSEPITHYSKNNNMFRSTKTYTVLFFVIEHIII